MGIFPQTVGCSHLTQPVFRHLTGIYRGFRSSFDRGCLSLWFNFRRNVSLHCLTARPDNVFDGVTVLPQIDIHFSIYKLAPLTEMFVSAILLEM
jgi:hypothetical protein